MTNIVRSMETTRMRSACRVDELICDVIKFDSSGAVVVAVVL